MSDPVSSSNDKPPIRVLLIEDNEDDYIILRDLLVDIPVQHFLLQWVKTYDEAVSALSQSEYDVCFLDYQLGEHSGIELLSDWPGKKEIPIIFLTGNEDYEIDAAATKAGAADYLLKGHINAPLLERSIRYAIERKKSEAALSQAQRFAQATVDALPDTIAVIDENGIIVAVNAAWRTFANLNGIVGSTYDVGTNYLEVCEGSDDGDALASARGIRAVMRGERKRFTLEYPCDSPTEQRWFQMSATRFTSAGPLFVVLAHEDITERKRSEQQLREKEAHLAIAQQIVRMGSWVWSVSDLENYRIVPARWSDGVFRIFGLEPNEVEPSYDVFIRLVHPDERIAIAASIRHALENRQDLDIEHRIVLKDGAERVVHVRAEMLYAVDGKSLQMVGTVQDITERKQNEEALRQSTELLRAVTEGTSDAIFAKDLEGRYLMINSAGANYLDNPIEAIIGRTDAEIASLESAHDFAETDRRVMETGVVQTSEEIGTVNGVTRTYLAIKGPLRGARGDVVGIVGISRDITERKQYESALAQLAAIVESSTDAIIGKTLDGVITSWNAAASALYGYSADEAIGRPVSMLVPPGYPNNEREILEKVGRGEPVRPYETVRLHKDGRLLEISRTVSPLRNERGEIIGASAISRDISERKRAENALRASEERFRAFMDNTPAAVTMKNGEGQYVYLNKAVEHFFDTPISELLGKTCFDIHPAEVARRIRENDLKVFSSGEPQQFEEIVTSPDGQTHHGLTIKFLLDDVDGERLLAEVAIDVTRQRQAEEERDRFFTTSLDMLCIIGADGYFKRLNPAFSEVLGFTEAEILLTPFLELVHPEDRSETKSLLETLSGGVSMVGIENRYLCKDGSWRWIEWKCVTSTESDLIYGAARDVTDRILAAEQLELRVAKRTEQLAEANVALQSEITERKRAELEIRRQARQQEAVAELGERALSGIELDILFDGALALVAAIINGEVCSILELLPEGKDLLVRAGLGLPEDLVGHAIVSADINSPAGHSLMTGDSVIIENLAEETRFQPATLALKQGLASSANVVIPGRTQPYGVLCVGSRQYKTFHRDDVHFLEAIANVLASAIERKGAETEVRRLNDGLREANEQFRIEVIERQMAISALRESTEALEIAIGETEQSRKEAEAANQAKSEFLSRMSHELRTPLNAILGFGQVLEMEDISDDQRESVQHILKAGRHLLNLINEVLDIARIEAGRVLISPEPISVSAVVQELLDLVRPLAAPRKIGLVNEVEAMQEDWHVLADQQRLKQILLNLLSNAIKYNRDGGQVFFSCEVATDESTGRTAPAARKLRLLVRDTGPGLTPEEIEKLFVPFERLGAKNTRIEGTGIGLALCKRLTELLGGQIGLQSEVGQGSTFWIELPVAEHPLQRHATPEEQVAPLLSDLPLDKVCNVLCIEDNLSNLKLIERALDETMGKFHIIPATQGSVGLELARQRMPDLILLDIHLPDIMGDVVLRRLQADPVTRAIPVVVLSADATPDQIERLLAAGARAYLTKPLDLQNFFNVIKEILVQGETK